MSMEVGQPVLGLHMFRNLAEEEINMAAVNMSKTGPMICVNSYYADHPLRIHNQTTQSRH